jgi:hypothetical protein
MSPASRRRNTSLVEVNTEKLKDHFQQLSDKAKALYNILRETHRNRGLGELAAAEALIRAESAEKDLREVPLWALDHCFTLARNDHNPDSPFQLCEVVQAWRRFKGDNGESTRVYSEWMAAHSKTALPAADAKECVLCGGTSWCHVQKHSFQGVPCEHRKYLLPENDRWLIDKLILESVAEKHICDGDERWAINLNASRGEVEGYRLRRMRHDEAGEAHGVIICPNKCKAVR